MEEKRWASLQGRSQGQEDRRMCCGVSGAASGSVDQGGGGLCPLGSSLCEGGEGSS